MSSNDGKAKKRNLVEGGRPLLVYPSLASELGLNEAIMLSQIHYWLQRSTNYRDGFCWTYHTYHDWQAEFPFWSRNTIIRTVGKLKSNGYVITGNYNKAGYDNTIWYRIDYSKVDAIPSTQNGQGVYPEWVDGSTQNGQTNTIDYTETTTKTNNPIVGQLSIAELTSEFQVVWKQYPSKTEKQLALNHYVKWRREDKSHTNDYLLDRLTMYKSYLKSHHKEKPVHGSTWFNKYFKNWRCLPPKEQGGDETPC